MTQLIRGMHLSDLHFGVGRRLSREDHPLEYLERHVSCLKPYIQIIKAEKIDFCLVSGDLFESSTTKLQELIEAAQFFQELGAHCPTLATAGNHDEEEKGTFQTRNLKRLKIPNVHFVDKPTSFALKKNSKGKWVFDLESNQTDPVRVLAVQWTGIKEQEEFTRYLSNHHDGEPIVMLHECFKGIVTDTGYRAIKGVQVPDLPGVKYFACGDIHKHQKLNLPHAWYSGSQFQQNYGDSPDKGCMIVSIDPDTLDYAWEFRKVSSPIELRVAYSLEEIPTDTPHWWQLRLPASQYPAILPEYVRSRDPLTVEMPVTAQNETDQEQEAVLVQIDYREGVSELLTANQYGELEIESSLFEIDKTLKSAGF